MLAIVISRADCVSEHVGRRLLELADWRELTDDSFPDADGGGSVYRTDDVELRTFERIHLELDHVSAVFDDPDVLVFASRHAGETGPLLTAHYTGNFGPAEFGGEDGTLARACPNAHRRVVRALTHYAPERYDVGIECTHHGPSDVCVPSMFVEVGSDESQWNDPDAARAVARAILDLRDTTPDSPGENGLRRHLVGFGGGHYAPRFERIIRETDWALGHVAADWCLDALGESAARSEVVRAAFEGSNAAYALFEADRPELRRCLDRLGYRIVSETWVRETSGVPLGFVRRLEDEVIPVASGLRFGALAAGYDGPYEVAAVSSDLLDEANGIDSTATRDVIESTVLAFGSEQNGTLCTGPFVVKRSDDIDEVLDGLADVLSEKYDEIQRTDDEILASMQAFDPERARELGVPEGPKFGQLAAGHPVETDERTVVPREVRTTRERQFNP